MSGDDRQNSPSISRQNRPSATAFMGAGDWIPPVPAFLFQRNHPHGGKALPRNRTAKNTAPLAYAIRLRGRVPADAALTKMDGKMADFFGEKDS